MSIYGNISSDLRHVYSNLDKLMNSAVYFKRTGDSVGSQMLATIALGWEKDFEYLFTKENISAVLVNCNKKERKEIKDFLDKHPDLSP